MIGVFPTLAPRLPTPVRLCLELSTPHAELWIKDDGLIHPHYGGNKVRKLARILERAQARGAKRVLTVGAAGSHHVLTTALFAPGYGLRVAAVLGPQPRTPHAESILLATVAHGVEIVPVPRLYLAPFAVAGSLRPGDYWVPPGGSNWLGAAAYADAVLELRQQIAAGELPAPDVIVVALGSGGTAAGLLAGVVLHGLSARIAAVQVVPGPLPRRFALSLARRLLPRAADTAAMERRLDVVGSELGGGYGVPSEGGRRAQELAPRAGIDAEPTYTAKAFAHALARVERASAGPRQRILYWHTLSSTPAPAGREPGRGSEYLSPRLRRLLPGP